MSQTILNSDQSIQIKSITRVFADSLFPENSDFVPILDSSKVPISKISELFELYATTRKIKPHLKCIQATSNFSHVFYISNKQNKITCYDLQKKSIQCN
jgi:hypothetical protein